MMSERYCIQCFIFHPHHEMLCKRGEVWRERGKVVLFKETAKLTGAFLGLPRGVVYIWGKYI